MEEVYKEISANIGQAVGAAIFAFAAYLYGRLRAWQKHHVNSATVTKIGLDRVISIENILADVRRDLGADRAIIYQFKNGEYYASGESVQKLIMTHCVCRTGISFPILSSQNESIQVSFISGLLVDLMDHKSVNHVVTKVSENFYLRSFWLVNGTIFSKMRGLFNFEGKMIGVLALNYITEDYQPYKETDLIDTAGRIAANLMG
jgi:hypothetical protein